MFYRLKHIPVVFFFLIPLLSGGYNMCTNFYTTDTIGNVYDAGGPNGNYSNNQNCQFLIDPGCNASITLSFSNFNIETGYDFLYVYDGATPSGKLLLTATGSNLPPNATAYSGKMLLVFTSDPSVTLSGFRASWSVLKIHVKPFPVFIFPTQAPPLNSVVPFRDMSLNYPNRWHWDFGDGDTSNIQHPFHQFRQYDTFKVKLIAYNCSGKDSVIHNLYPQDSAFIGFSPDSFSHSTSSCSETTVKTLKLFNTGRGDLVYSLSAGDTAGGIRLLTLTYGVDYANEYTNTMTALSQYYPYMPGVEINTINPDTLKSALQNKNILLIAEQETGSAAIFKTFSPVLLDYVYNGGNVIFCGSASSQSNCMFNTGLFHGSYARNSIGKPLRILNKQHPLTYNLDTVLFGTDATYSCRITDQNTIHLVGDSANYDVLAYREFGNGKVFFIAYDYTIYDSNSSKTLSNIFRWVSTGLLPTWLSLNVSADTIPKNDSSTVALYMGTNGLRAGKYMTMLKLASNDIAYPKHFIRCNFQINGSAVATLSDTLIHYDTVMQYADVTDTVMIGNTGCDSLKVTGLNFKTAHFSAQPSQFTVLPGSSQALIVHFHPLITGTFRDTLNIISNAGKSKITLIGNASFPATAKVTIDSSQFSMMCEDSTEFKLVIKNTNLQPLLINIEGKNAPDSVRFIALTYGVDYYQEYANTMLAIKTYFNDYHFSELNTTLPWVLDSALRHNDVLLIPEQETGSSNVFTSFSSTLQSFVMRGGTVIFCGAFGTQMNCVFNTGLFSGTPGTIVFNNSYYLNVFDSTQEITAGMGSVIPSLNATFTASLTNPNTKRLIDYDGTYDVAAYRNIGSGRAIFLAFDYFDYDSNISKLIANAVKSSVKQLKPSWISMSTYDDTIAYSDSTVVHVKINTKGLLAGNYHYDITIHSNDPQKSIIQLPVDLEVHCKPYADFSVFSNYVNRNDSIAFTDKSKNFPTSWHWSFQGGSPATSVLKNPYATYRNYGDFDVRLIATNSWGSDTVEKKAFIHTANSVILCSATKTYFDSGYVFDMGGPLNNYNAMQTCQLLIAPPCAKTITLNFSEFNVENNWDYLYIYDGEDAKSPLLKSLTGNTIPAPVTALSGKMFLKFVTDQLVEESGFSAYWTSVIPIGYPPVAAFGADNYDPPLNSKVLFVDSTLPPANSWHWDFADGNTSDMQNPTHVFYKPGNYSVKLVVSNCYGKDSVYRLIRVQDFPVMTYKPSSVSGSSICSDQDTSILSIYNSGKGVLSFEADTGQRRQLELLTYTYGANFDQAYPNTLQALYRYYPNIHLSEISTLDTNKLRKAMSNKDLIIVPELQKGIPGIFSDFSYSFYEFVSAGGVAIFCGSYDAQSECMFNTGLFTGSYKDYVYLSTDSITIVDPTNKITRGFGKKLPGEVITYYYSITNPDVVRLMTYQGNDVLSYRRIGKGTAIFIGYNFYNYSDTLSQIWGNLINWATSTPLPPWLKVIPTKSIITDSLQLKVIFDRNKTQPGTIKSTIAFYTNDTLKRKNYVPVQFTSKTKYNPVVLPANIRFCSGDSAILNAGNNFKTYLWNDSVSTDSSITVKSGGVYSVTVTDSNDCISSDSTVITLHPLPSVKIQEIDSSYCSNSGPVKLNAAPAGGIFGGNGIISGMFYPDIPPPGSVSIFYVFTDTNTCSNSDTIYSKVVKSPVVNLGSDTTLVMGSSLVLDAGAGFISSVWNKVLDSRYLYITASIPGNYLYYVDVTDSNGCTGCDSIYITIKDTFVSAHGIAGKYAINVYPNPAHGYFFVDFHYSLPAQTSISLLSADGKEMISRQTFISSTHTEQIDISSLAKGIYMLKIIHGSDIDRIRVVVY